MMHTWALKSGLWPWRRFFTKLICTWGGVRGLTCILACTAANPILRAHLEPQSAQIFGSKSWKFSRAHCGKSDSAIKRCNSLWKMRFQKCHNWISSLEDQIGALYSEFGRGGWCLFWCGGAVLAGFSFICILVHIIKGSNNTLLANTVCHWKAYLFCFNEITTLVTQILSPHFLYYLNKVSASHCIWACTFSKHKTAWAILKIPIQIQTRIYWF